jgi:hypothetical protein
VLKRAPLVVASLIQLAEVGCSHSAPDTAPNPGTAAGRLTGSWAVQFRLDSMGLDGVSAQGRDVRGRIWFRPEFTPKGEAAPSSANSSAEEQEQIRRLEWGRFEIDFSPYWQNGPIAPVRSTTLLGNPEEPLKEALGLVIGRDTVGILLNPHFTHGGLGLSGRFLSDSLVVGRWGIRGDTTRSGGTFEMQRDPKQRQIP